MGSVNSYPGANSDHGDSAYYYDGWLAQGSPSTIMGNLRDSSDTSYVTDSAGGSQTNGHRIKVPMETVTIPGGAAITGIVPKFRVGADPNRSKMAAYLQVPDYYGNTVYSSPISAINPQKTSPAWQTISEPPSPYVVPDPDDERPDSTADPFLRAAWILDHLSGLIGANYGAAGNGDRKVSEFYLVVNYNEQPVASNLAVAGESSGEVTDSTRPALSWDYTDPELDPQYAYRVSIWNADDATDLRFWQYPSTDSFIALDGTTRRAVASSADADGNLTVYSADQSWKPPVDLSNGDYVAYVQVAQLIDGQYEHWSSANDSLSWTQNTTPPATPTITAAAWDPVRYAVAIDVSVPAFAHTPTPAADLLVQRSVDGGSSWETLPIIPSQDDGTTAWAATVYDTLCCNGDEAIYRAMALYDDGTSQYGSNWTAATDPVEVTIEVFVLRDVLDPDGQALVTEFGGELVASSDEDLGVFWPSGSTAPRFVSGTVRLPKWQVPIQLSGEPAFAQLEELRKLQTTLLLQTDMAGVRKWVRFDQTMQTTILMTTQRRDATQRPYTISVPMWETVGVLRADGSQVDA